MPDQRASRTSELTYIAQDIWYDVRERLVPPLDRMYHIINKVFWFGIIVNFAVQVIVTLARSGVEGLRDWPGVQWLELHPLAVVGIAVFGILLLLLTLIGLAAHRSKLSYLAHNNVKIKAGNLIPVRIRDLKLEDFDLGPNPHKTYFKRDQHYEVCDALQQAMRGSKAGQRGVVIWGKLMVGKTRLAFEAVREVLGNRRRLLVWQPSFGSLPIEDFQQFQDQRLALLLDNMQLLAQQKEAGVASDVIERVNYLHRICERLVIVATGRDGTDQDNTKPLFQPLLEYLSPFTVAPIEKHSSEENEFFRELDRAGIKYNENSFDGTPGSALLDLDRRTALLMDPRFPPAALAILKAMKLLRTAYVDEYPEQRVRRVARIVFGYGQTEKEWRDAIDRLTKDQWLRWKPIDTLTRLVDSYLDVCVKSVYESTGRRIEDDFPKLMEALSEDPADADALFSLSAALRRNEALQQNPLGSYANQVEMAIECVKTGLSALVSPLGDARQAELWARGQSLLGLAYYISEHGDTITNLRLALDAFGEALIVRAQDKTSGKWADTVYNRALVRRDIAVAVSGLDGNECSDQREKALRELKEVQTVFTSDTYPDQYDQVIDLYRQLEEEIRCA